MISQDENNFLASYGVKVDKVRTKEYSIILQMIADKVISYTKIFREKTENTLTTLDDSL